MLERILHQTYEKFKVTNDVVARSTVERCL